MTEHLFSALRRASTRHADVLATELAAETSRLDAEKEKREPLGPDHWHRQHRLREKLRVAEALERAFTEIANEPPPNPVPVQPTPRPSSPAAAAMPIPQEAVG